MFAKSTSTNQLSLQARVSRRANKSCVECVDAENAAKRQQRAVEKENHDSGVESDKGTEPTSTSHRRARMLLAKNDRGLIRLAVEDRMEVTYVGDLPERVVWVAVEPEEDGEPVLLNCRSFPLKWRSDIPREHWMSSWRSTQALEAFISNIMGMVTPLDGMADIQCHNRRQTGGRTFSNTSLFTIFRD